jgi:hypothetical protein
MTTIPYSPVNTIPVVRWHGISRTAYDMHLHAIGGTVHPPVGGIYIACRAAVGGWRGLYVGEAESLYERITQRLAQHHRWKAMRAVGATHFCTLHVPDDDALRLWIETDLRHALNPVCNRQ